MTVWKQHISNRGIPNHDKNIKKMPASSALLMIFPYKKPQEHLFTDMIKIIKRQVLKYFADRATSKLTPETKELV